MYFKPRAGIETAIAFQILKMGKTQVKFQNFHRHKFHIFKHMYLRISHVINLQSEGNPHSSITNIECVLWQ